MDYKKGQTLKVKKSGAEVYFIDVFDADDGERIMLLGGAGPDTLYLPESDIEVAGGKVDKDQLALNVLTDIALSVKTTNETITELYELVAPRCPDCGSLTHPIEDDEDESEVDDEDPDLDIN